MLKVNLRLNNPMAKFPTISEINILREQVDLRSQHNILQQLVCICQYVKNKFATKQFNGLVFFDVENAFNCIWHSDFIF